MTSHTFSRLLITFEIPPGALAKLEKAFSKVYYLPDAAETAPSKEVLADVDVWFMSFLRSGVSQGITLDDVPKLRLVQLTSAGANAALKLPLFGDARWSKQLSLSSASGIHVLSIPQYVIGQIVNLYMNIHNQHWILRSEAKWPDRSRLGFFPGANTHLAFESLRGKTAGLLGYGHIARETARLLKAFGVQVIAANTRGNKTADEGYVIPGTGDLDGSIPSAYYATSDPKSFDEFLGRSDILVASLPSTPATTYLLKEHHLRKLPQGALFINVGRGDLVSSDDLLSVLNPPDPASPISADNLPHLLGAGLDVTDPEPLPDNHPLFTHPRALITPHTSGNFNGYLDAATDLLVANVKHVRKGGKAYNLVDPKKGY